MSLYFTWMIEAGASGTYRHEHDPEKPGADEAATVFHLLGRHPRRCVIVASEKFNGLPRSMSSCGDSVHLFDAAHPVARHKLKSGTAFVPSSIATSPASEPVKQAG